MGFTVLNVAPLFAQVGPDAAGGASQTITQLDEALESSGHRSFLIAARGAHAAGKIFYLPRYTEALEKHRDEALNSYRQMIQEAIRKYPIDLVHLHGTDFQQYLPEGDLPVLVTLHRPANAYTKPVWPIERPNVYLHCVSAVQRRGFPASIPFLPDIHSTVDYQKLQSSLRKRTYVLALGRIAPDKNFHVAIAAAVRAGVPLLLAGELLPFTACEEYFEERLAPRFDEWRRFLGPVRFARKRRLLTSARCLLIPNEAGESNTLVAMEALACGTPVVAFANGTLPDIIEHGRTGILVQDEREMASAIARADQLSSETCRVSIRERFPLSRMIAEYISQYELVLARPYLG